MRKATVTFTNKPQPPLPNIVAVFCNANHQFIALDVTRFRFICRYESESAIKSSDSLSKDVVSVPLPDGFRFDHLHDVICRCKFSDVFIK